MGEKHKQKIMHVLHTDVCTVLELVPSVQVLRGNLCVACGRASALRCG